MPCPTKRFFLVTVCVIFVLFAARAVWLYFDAQMAITKWESVGGGVSVQNSKYGFGPDSMSLGSMPAIGTSDDLTRIRDAAVKMNGTPGCRKLHLAQPAWSCEHLLFLLTPLNLDYLGLDQIALDDECVMDISKLPDIRSIGIGSGPISLDGIRYFLRSSPQRTMRVCMRLKNADRDELKREFEGRISFE